MITSGNWTFPSPLLPPASFTPSLPPLSPLPGFITPNNTCAGGYLAQGQFPCNSTPTLPSPQYFQWPTPHTHHPMHSNRVSSPIPYQQMHHKMELEHYPSTSCTPAASLPDFEAVYTTLSN